uniref:Putative secreted peptide n=1 Tax=Anopheles braziliensis TaxID=58242 RepID=A0A2M3ZQI9_9DIPT
MAFVVAVVLVVVVVAAVEVSLVPFEVVNRTTPCGPADTRRIAGPADRSLSASARSVPVTSCLMVASSGLLVVVVLAVGVVVVVVWLGVVGEVMWEGEVPPVSLAHKLRWDSGDDGGVRVGSRSGAFVVRATNRSSIPAPPPLPPF